MSSHPLTKFHVREGHVEIDGYAYDGVGVYCAMPGESPVIIISPDPDKLPEYFERLTGRKLETDHGLLPVTMSSPMMTNVKGWRWHKGRGMWIVDNR